MNKDLHANFKKRGMKFAHVNITTLPGHYADDEVLPEKAVLDVFAVTESHLDCTLLIVRYILRVILATEKIEIAMEVVAPFL